MSVNYRKNVWLHSLKRYVFLPCIVATVMFLACYSSIAEKMSWEQYVLEVRTVEAKYGYYAEWPLVEKEKLIKALIDMGYMKNSSATKQLSEMDSDRSKSALADQIMLIFMGGDDNPLVCKDGLRSIRWSSLTDVIMGRSITWSPAEKAWYQKVANMYRETVDPDTMVAPESEDLPELEAIAIAKASIISAYGLESNALDSYIPNTYLYVTKNNPDYRRWHIGFHYYQYGTADGVPIQQHYVAIVDENGEVIADPEMGFLHVQEMAEKERDSQSALINKTVYK